MSPFMRVEVQVFREIVAILRRWASGLERRVDRVGEQTVGPDWAEGELLELYEAWLQVGYAIRDVARTRPTADGVEPRPEVLAMRDGLARIADIVDR
jgi:hypothetical protein